MGYTKLIIKDNFSSEKLNLSQFAVLLDHSNFERLIVLRLQIWHWTLRFPSASIAIQKVMKWLLQFGKSTSSLYLNFSAVKWHSVTFTLVMG